MEKLAFLIIRLLILLDYRHKKVYFFNNYVSFNKGVIKNVCYVLDTGSHQNIKKIMGQR